LSSAPLLLLFLDEVSQIHARHFDGAEFAAGLVSGEDAKGMMPTHGLNRAPKLGGDLFYPNGFVCHIFVVRVVNDKKSSGQIGRRSERQDFY
jgi:hypothetical protein